MLLLYPDDKCVVLVDPFRQDSRDDVTANFLKWYQDEATARFPGAVEFHELDTKTWRVIRASTNLYNSIFTPIQTDGYSCGVLSAMMAYHYIMYGELPTNEFFTCAPEHVKEMRLFMFYEIARLSSLPPNWTTSETNLYNATREQIAANRSVRKQRNKQQRELNAANPANVFLNVGLIALDEEFAKQLDEELNG